MLFNSIDFAAFLPIVFSLYWFVSAKNLKLQNLLIVLVSYVFYGWWDSRFLALILFSTFVDYIVGICLSKQENPKIRKLLLAASIIVNLGLLGFFKYFNFFIENFASAFTLFGFELQANTLQIILPVGISFYTFQTLSYSIDIYRRKLTATKDFVAFAAFVSFFPQLVAGPIERAAHLLPQFFKKRHFDYSDAVSGMYQIIWGMFKKVVIADNCAQYADIIFKNSADYSSSTLILGALFFTFQVYGDFSGYSDIAIGTARLFGLNLSRNFNLPYFSRDIAEFWRRWHISLSTWFRDYLYIPLGGSRGSVAKNIRNTFIIFIVSGFWHGANWTFVLWGFLNALYIVPIILANKNRKNIEIVAAGKLFPSFRETVAILLTFSLTVLAMVVFRAESVEHAIRYIGGIFTQNILQMPYYIGIRKSVWAIGMVVLLIVIEWFTREQQFPFQKQISEKSAPFLWIFYYLIALLIFLFGANSQAFIYFQF